jgi:hypothetical protein
MFWGGGEVPVDIVTLSLALSSVPTLELTALPGTPFSNDTIGALSSSSLALGDTQPSFPVTTGKELLGDSHNHREFSID